MSVFYLLITESITGAKIEKVLIVQNIFLERFIPLRRKENKSEISVVQTISVGEFSFFFLRRLTEVKKEGLSNFNESPAQGWLVGLEPTTYRATICRASQLRHSHHLGLQI